MSDETARLKLAQLVSLQELNAVTWNEALAQLDALVDLYLLGQFVNTPPSSPQDGDAYLVGGTPTGAWTGYAYKIATCLDGAWRFYQPFNGLRAFVANTSAFIVYLNGIWTDWNSLISANEVSVASAATCDLGAAGSLFVQITGTTTITSFGAQANRLRYVRFAQGLTLTHNAASLILLGGANRTTAAGDVGVYASDASGNWRERDYFRAAANPGDYATKSGSETLSNKTFSGATSFPGGIWNSSGSVGIGTQGSLSEKLVVCGGRITGGTYAASVAGTYLDLSANASASYPSIAFGVGGGAEIRFVRVSTNNIYLQGFQAGKMCISHWAGTDGLDIGVGNDALTSPYPITFSLNNVERMRIVGNEVKPGSDNTINLGSASLRWATVYAGTGTINTSGEAEKTAIRALSADEIAVATDLVRYVCLFRFRNAVARKGPDRARLHAGMIAKGVFDTFRDHKLDPFDYGICCRDPDPARPEGWIEGLRYDELAQFVIAGLAARLAALEAK